MAGLDTGLPVRLLRGPVRSLLKGERPEQPRILPAITRRGKAILCRITGTPLSGSDQSIEGVLLLMEGVR